MDCLYPIQNAVRILNDDDHVRWPLEDLVEYLNAGIREIVRVKPTASTITITTNLAPGVWQEIPSIAQALISVDVDETSGRSIRLVSEDALDAVMPLWTASNPSRNIKDYIFDPRNPRRYLVYPPAIAQTPITITVVKRIEPITKPNNSSWPAFPLAQEYSDIVTDFILGKAYQSTQGQGSQMRAASYMQGFYSALGVTASGELMVNPEIPDQEGR